MFEKNLFENNEEDIRNDPSTSLKNRETFPTQDKKCKENNPKADHNKSLIILSMNSQHCNFTL